MRNRPKLSRRDLDPLKQLDRPLVFQALGSFDENGLAESVFILKTVELLDPARVPGLVATGESGDVRRIGDAVLAACKGRPGPGIERFGSAKAVGPAEEILANRFNFYGEPHQLPASIDWDYNPGTGHWAHDLNRFSYLTPLVEAYLATGDERFSRKAIGLILDWIDKCDFSMCFRGTPYAFFAYLSEALHCKQWSSCVTALVARDQVRPLELLRILKSMHDQMAHLEIVTNGDTGNCATMGLLGILSTLAAFPVFYDTDRFVDYCVDAMAFQIEDQVLPDGVQDELTPHYHWVVVKTLLDSLEYVHALGRTLKPETMATLHQMIYFLQHTIVPDHSKQAGFNDSDPGAVPVPGPSLERVGLGHFLADENRLGPECFPYAGMAFLRQLRAEGDLYLAFDAGPYGRCHQHEDKLGFWLFAYGRNFLVDPGRHLYFEDSEVSFRWYLSSTTAHSTIKVDDKGQHSKGRPGTWVARAPLDLGWSATTQEVRASGIYDLGYGEDNALAVTHWREIVFVQNRFWVIFDLVSGEGVHLLESRFQFAPGSLRIDGAKAWTCFPDSNLLLVHVAPVPYEDIHVECGQESPRGGWYSDSYGRIEPAPALSFSVKAPLPVVMATLLFPYRGEPPPAMTLSLDGNTVTVQGPEIGTVRVLRAN